jgi:hypothetical protein
MNYYEYYRARLNQGRPMTRKKVANNTWAELVNDHIAIVYHVTTIAKLYPNGDVQLFTGGWRTVSTKDRLNGLGNFHVWQENYQWYVADFGTDWSNKTPFYDGVKFNQSGIRINDPRYV